MATTLSTVPVKELLLATTSRAVAVVEVEVMDRAPPEFTELADAWRPPDVIVRPLPIVMPPAATEVPPFVWVTRPFACTCTRGRTQTVVAGSLGGGGPRPLTLRSRLVPSDATSKFPVAAACTVPYRTQPVKPAVVSAASTVDAVVELPEITDSAPPTTFTELASVVPPVAPAEYTVTPPVGTVIPPLVTNNPLGPNVVAPLALTCISTAALVVRVSRLAFKAELAREPRMTSPVNDAGEEVSTMLAALVLVDVVVTDTAPDDKMRLPVTAAPPEVTVAPADATVSPPLVTTRPLGVSVVYPLLATCVATQNAATAQHGA